MVEKTETPNLGVGASPRFWCGEDVKVFDLTPIERFTVDILAIIPLSVWIDRGIDRLK